MHQHAISRANIAPEMVEDVFVGCGIPEGATGFNIARNGIFFQKTFS
jgi:acetyl-CoA C-acetyltransferase